MKKIIVGFLSLLMGFSSLVSLADEGMWLLPFIKDKNMAQMKQLGFKLSAEDIYSINQSALKDAIVIFGGGCTGEVVSDQGLLFTNHHCGYGTIQSHSSVESDYLKNGYWAKSFDREIPSPGLGVIFIREVKDVTDKIVPFLSDTMSQRTRQAKVNELVRQITKNYDDSTHNITATIQSMFAGNQYLLFVQERFGDVRFVGAPPTSIGKFGGDTDNWMWPRHTGDFSVFRIYSNREGRSTKDYDKGNVPYKAPVHLTISSKGYQEGSPSMIIGFPGRTNRYMTSWEIDQVLSQDNPIRINIRGEKQKLIWEDMLASDAVRIKYAAKYSGSSNYWKNSIGMSRGLKRLHIGEKKQAQQDAFTAWVNADAARKAKYGQALPMIKRAVAGRMPMAKQSQITSEIFGSTESIAFARKVYDVLAKADSVTWSEKLQKLGNEFFKNYNMATDKRVTKRLLELYGNYTSSEEQLPFFVAVRSDEGAWVESYFSKSIFADQNRFNEFIKNPSLGAMGADMVIAEQLSAAAQCRLKAKAEFDDLFAQGQRLYLAGLLEMRGGVGMYPDANFTQRMTYGQVLPYKGADALHYDFNTTLSGVMEKENADDPEFVVDAKLKELWLKRDFGRWAVNGDVPVAFLSNNDITGGNSGSPIMNGKGELIGLAFDGNWEAMSGDIAFEPALQRCISVDVRYVLFVIDKVAGAQRLIDELTIN